MQPCLGASCVRKWLANPIRADKGLLHCGQGNVGGWPDGEVLFDLYFRRERSFMVPLILQTS